MELKEYLSIFKKYLVFIILCFVLGIVLGALTTNLLPSGYNLSQTFYLNIPTPSNTPQSENYDGFYAQERARNFTDTAVAILESSDFQSEVVIETQALLVKKLAPQVVRLTTIAQNRESSKDLMRKTTDTYNRKFTGISLSPIASPREPSFKRSSRKIYAAAGAVLGFATAVVVISLKSYFRL
ncbi:MAG: hypothetical protein Q8P25_04400 [Candidatus Curtissbacteria bacterium]|nr:hypothetical protein [Candidatus Curtissbacteria bacterium]